MILPGDGPLNEADATREEIVKLRGELRFAEEREAAVRDVIQTIAQSTFDLDRVLQTVIDRAVGLCHGHNGNIARLDGDIYRIVAFTSFAPEYEQLDGWPQGVADMSEEVPRRSRVLADGSPESGRLPDGTRSSDAPRRLSHRGARRGT